MKKCSITGMFATIPISQLAQELAGAALSRTLGPGALVAIGIGAIIGTGIFVLTGLAAAQHAGPAIVFSFLVAALVCAVAGLCYAEFASMLPVSGSAYTYTYATLGEIAAWFVGWNLVLEYLFAAATVAAGWARYFVKLTELLGPMPLPEALVMAPLAVGPAGHSLVATGALLDLPAVVIGLVATAVCCMGVRQSTTMKCIVVAIKPSGEIKAFCCAVFLPRPPWRAYRPLPIGGPGC